MKIIGKYHKCDNSCKIKFAVHPQLIVSSVEYEDNYYFIDGEGECKLKDFIEQNYANYFFPFGGDTYQQCDSNCYTWSYKGDYCTSYDDTKSLFEDNQMCYESYDGYYSYNDEGKSYFFIKKFK